MKTTSLHLVAATSLIPFLKSRVRLASSNRKASDRDDAVAIALPFMSPVTGVPTIYGCADGRSAISLEPPALIGRC
jgi:hypothetical protein